MKPTFPSVLILSAIFLIILLLPADAEDIPAPESLEYSLNQLKERTKDLKIRNLDLDQRNSRLRQQLASLKQKSHQSTLPDGRNNSSNQNQLNQPRTEILLLDEHSSPELWEKRLYNLKEEEASLSEKIKEKRARQVDSEKEIATLEEHLRELEQSISDNLTERERDLRRQKAELKKHLEESQKRLRGLKAGQLVSNPQKQSKKEMTLTASRKQLNDKLAAMAKEMDDLFKEEESLRAKQISLEDKNSDGLETLEKEIAFLDQRKNELSQYLALIRGKFKTEGIVSVNLPKEEAGLEESIRTLKKQNEFLEEEILRLMGSMVKLDRKKFKIKWQLDESGPKTEPQH